MRPLLALLVLVLDVIALVSVFGAPLRPGRRIAWTAAVVLLPPVGALLWLLRSRRGLQRRVT